MLELIVISGVPGVGKTAVAEQVAARLHAVHLSVDPAQDAMLACGLPDGWHLGVAAYEAVRTMVEQNLALGLTVVVDAVNDSDPARETWRRAATRHRASLHLVHLITSDPAVHRKRLEARNRGFGRLPEPTWDEVRARLRAYQPWSEPHLELDTASLDPSQAAGAVIERITATG